MKIFSIMNMPIHFSMNTLISSRGRILPLCHYAIIPFCACAKRDLPSLEQGLGTRLERAQHCYTQRVFVGVSKYCWTAWYVVVLFAKWCFYNEFPVECNGKMAMIPPPHSTEEKSLMRNQYTTNSDLTKQGLCQV